LLNQKAVTTTRLLHKSQNIIQALLFALVVSLSTQPVLAQEYAKPSAGQAAVDSASLEERSNALSSFQFAIKEVHNRAEAKLFNEQVRGMFDTLPTYDEKTNSFSFQSRFVFDSQDILDKLTQLGFEAVYFKEVKEVE